MSERVKKNADVFLTSSFPHAMMMSPMRIRQRSLETIYFPGNNQAMNCLHSKIFGVELELDLGEMGLHSTWRHGD